MPFQLEISNAVEYLSSKGLIAADEVTAIESLGGGVSNTLVKVTTLQDCLVVKQSLPQLRVSGDWFADRERIFRERACIDVLSGLLPEGTIPRVYHEDRENFLFVMSCAPENGANWKDQLLAGQVEQRIAAKVGRVLAVIHNATAGDQQVRQQFLDDRPFVQLRIDPYHRTTAQAHPDLAQIINGEASRMLEIKSVLVHGDYSPKNIIVADGEVFLLDFEVVHYGNPVFDLSFMLNHLLLKSIYNRHIKGEYFDAARAFWEGYTGGAPSHSLETDTVKQLGCLMLARVDGKSPVEYLVEPDVKDLVRDIARSVLLENIKSLEQLIDLLNARVLSPARPR